MDAVKFATKLQALRAEAGLTQGGLAEACGMPMGTIRNYEQGIREPSWETLFKLARALNVSVEVFAECVGDEAPPPAKAVKGGKAAKAKAPRTKRKGG